MKKRQGIKSITFYLWIGLILLAFLLIGDLHSYRETFSERAGNNIWRLCYLVVMNYLLLEYSLPWFRWRRFLACAALIFLHLMLYSWGLYAWTQLGISMHIYRPVVEFKTVSGEVADHMGYSVMTIFFFGIARHLYDHSKLKKTAQRLQIEKQQAELNYLKSQTNPHFLFNTLNNIYSLARDKSDLAPESILRLSKILRFMLYETTGEYIAIEQELKIMQDYIALEKLRYDDSLRVNFNYDVEEMKQSVPPLLLIPLVENAFKHGVSETRNQPFVDLHLSVKNRMLVFIVKNSTEEPAGTEKVKEQIGLSNLRRQLELLYNGYELTVTRQENLFTAMLKINLSSHV